ncbi:hypothetical protein [Flavobacterium geliluteum]|uniref:Uncharacterized protein n=1 Tax=Flavobacterium geliluteum TaxID=2816120 RepID=A0A940XAL4_9FLAO|nr:hypothetical protein [Flavobacterium geliluteum]MBP4138997.1 hypothetical protein [Flavobacterium geliluteum]
MQAGPDCVNGFKKARKRCQRDFGTCTLGALVSASAPPFWQGLVVEALCVVAKLNCDDDAEEDYNDCVLEEFIPGQLPPATGELTIHCDKFADTCWTTDSNGKYVKTLK